MKEIKAGEILKEREISEEEMATERWENEGDRTISNGSHQALQREIDNWQKEKFMKTTVGLWIDHRKAIIVFLAGEEEGNKANQVGR